MSLINNEQAIPFTLAVTRRDGTVKRVRLGVAMSGEDGLILHVGEAGLDRLRELMGDEQDRPTPSYGTPIPAPPPGRYVPSSVQELQLYADRARRTLADPAKARWHDRERAVLAAIEAELRRHRDGDPPGDEARTPIPTDPGPGRAR